MEIGNLRDDVEICRPVTGSVKRGVPGSTGILPVRMGGMRKLRKFGDWRPKSGNGKQSMGSSAKTHNRRLRTEG